MPGQSPAGDSAGKDASPAISVLYVDDEPALLEPTRLSLEKNGLFTVDTTTSAQEALEKIRERSYDVIVSDYQMPEMNGIQFLKHLRQSGNLIPFIIFTGKGREDAVIQAYNAGADFYLAKGGDPRAMFLDLTHKIGQVVTRRRAEKALRESEERYRKVMEQSHDAIFIVSGSKFTFVNDRVSELSGYSKEELYGMEIWDFLHPDDRDRVMEISRNRMSGGPAPQTYEARVFTRNREVRYLEFAATTLVFSGENAALCSVRDVTERRNAEESLRRSEEKYRSIFNTFDDLYYQTDMQGIITTLSPSCTKITGWDPSELVGRQVLDLYPFPEQRKQLLGEMFTNGAVHDYEVILRNRNGNFLNVSVTSHIVYDDKGNPSGVEGALRDITERKRVEDALHASEEKFRTLTDFLPVIVFEADLEGKLTFANRLTYPTFGIEPADLASGINVIDYIVPEERTMAKENMLKVFRGESRGPSEYTLQRKDGSRFPAMIRASAIFDKKDGSASGIRAVIIDLTERKEADEALRQSETSYHGLFNAVKDAILILDRTGSFIDANRGAEEMFGHPHGFFWGDIIDQVSAPGRNDREHIKDLMDRAFLEGPQQFEFWARKSNGVEFLTDVRIYKGTYFGKDAIVTLAVDITDRKRAEEALQNAYQELEHKVEERTHELSMLAGSLQNEIAERNRVNEALTASEEKYRSLVELSLDGIIITDFTGTLLFANHAAGLIVDAPDYEEMIGKKNVLDFVAPESKAGVLLDFGKVAMGIDAYLVYYKLLTEKKREVWVECIGKKIMFGDSSAMLVSMRDITERRNLQNEVAASLREKEILLKEIHHRVKNNMQVISSLLSLQARLMKDEKSREAILESQNRVMSIALVHEKLYQSKSYATINYHEYLKMIADNLLQTYGIPRGKVRIDIHADTVVLPISRAIPISLMINEMLSNSLKYAFPGERTGIITVDLQKNGDRYSLTVGDNGIGLPDEIDLDHIETLGLQLVNSLVAQILGTITLNRSGGTEFRIDFSQEPTVGDHYD